MPGHAAARAVACLGRRLQVWARPGSAGRAGAARQMGLSDRGAKWTSRIPLRGARSPPPSCAAAATRRSSPSPAPVFDELADLSDALGQARAVEAIRFGIETPREGYNPFAMGPVGLGCWTVARGFLEQTAPAREVPADWCYVFNFDYAAQQAVRAASAAWSGAGFQVEHGAPGEGPARRHSRRVRVRRVPPPAPRKSSPALDDMRERASARSASAPRTRASRCCARRAVSASRRCARTKAVHQPAGLTKLLQEEQKRLEDAIAVLQADL